MAIDRDDVRYFLAVARHGSVRAAAVQLEVKQTTILKLIAQLVTRLLSLLFQKPAGENRLAETGGQASEHMAQLSTATIPIVN
ncbi:LysR family transcriptional regulator [Rhizobium leguminosarum]|uniref:helix-turn-helix domain-containing protein n=1 Tax=Rhizobium leguminosarum TaxID=384 RepID=UPI001C8FFE81|nr:LysR family transcriptional regulator [Rhizobium leguminosarum]